MLELCVCVNSFSMMTFYWTWTSTSKVAVIIILPQVFCSAFGVHLERRVWIAMLILPFILASSIRNLANMVPFCMVSNILLVYCIAVIIYAGINSML